MSNVSEKFGISENVELFFIGDEYYRKSSTIMSSIYVSKTFQRFNWGFVNRLLREGKSVTIRPATQEELNWADDKLNKVIQSFI